MNPSQSAGPLDTARVMRAVQDVESKRMSRGVEAIDPRVFKLQPDTLSYGPEPAAEGDGAANVTAMNDAIYAIKTTRLGECRITLPSGITRFEDSPWIIQNIAGLSVEAGGPNLGQGDTPEATSWYASARSSNFFYGSEVYGTGYGSQAIVEMIDVTCFRAAGLSIRGDGTDPAAYGVRVGKADGGLGPSTIYWLQLAVQNADVGMNVGRVSTTSGGYTAANCSEVTLVQPMFKVCEYGYETTHGQAVNHCLVQAQHTNGAALYKQTGGGNVLLVQPVTFDSESLIESAGGGSSAGTILVLNGRFDGQEFQTKLWNATASAFNVVTFISCNFVYSAATPNGPRITMYDNNYVNVLFCHNLSDGTSKPLVESANTGAKTLFVMGSRIETVSAGDMHSDKTFGTWHSGGEWRLVANIDNSESKFICDREYPRRNGRASTHRFQVETDFIADASPFTVSSSGAGAGGTYANPWDKYHVGILSLDTGSTNTGSAACISATNAVEFTGGPWRCEILARVLLLSVVTGGNPDPLGISASYPSSSGGITGTDSDADEQFTVRIGFCDSATGDGTDGAFFRYTDTVNGGRWECVTRDGGSETATDAGVLLTNAVALVDQDVHVFEVRVNPGGSSISFYLDGALAATNTTNLPDADDFTGMLPGQIVKSAGTNNRSLHIDYAYYDFVPSTARGTAYAK